VAVSGKIVILPPVFRIAFSDGERQELVIGAEFRRYWEAEHALHQLHNQYPDLLFWISMPTAHLQKLGPPESP
jgi:hypothetical protein